jgi:fucose permease
VSERLARNARAAAAAAIPLWFLVFFLYVGAEVAIGSLITNYLMQTDVFGLGSKATGDALPGKIRRAYPIS